MPRQRPLGKAACSQPRFAHSSAATGLTVVAQASSPTSRTGATVNTGTARSRGRLDGGPPGGNDEPQRTYTVDQAIDQVGFGRFQGLLLCYAGLAWMGEAMEMMLLSFVGPAVHDVWGLSSKQESAISSVVFAGMLVGAYSWGILSDIKGRRFGFLYTAVLTFAAGIASSFAQSYEALLITRCLVGVGLGGGPVVFSLFMEFVPGAKRGFWLVVITLFWTLGSIAEASLAWAVMPTLGWRWLLALSATPLALLLLFYNLIPESPRYLAAKGRLADARHVLSQVASVNGCHLPAGELVNRSHVLEGADQSGIGAASQKDVIAGDQEILGSDQLGRNPHIGPVSKLAQQDGPLSVVGSLLRPPLLTTTVLLWSVFFCNAFTYYGLVLLTSQIAGGAAGCDGDAPDAEAAEALSSTVVGAAAQINKYKDVLITSLAELPGLGVAALVVDRFGRKLSMSGFFASCGVFLLPLVHHQEEGLTTFLLFGARASIMGAFTILYIYAPEVYPTSTRSSGLGIANSFARIGGLVCPFVAVELVRSCQQTLAVTLFSVVPISAAVAVSFFPVETAGRSLEDTVQSGEGHS